MASIVILSPFGLQTDSLIGELLKTGKQFVYINLDQIMKKGKVKFDTKGYLSISFGSQKIQIKKVKSFYLDYFDLQEVFYFRRSDFNLREQLFIRRWLYILSLFEVIFADAKWVPSKPSVMGFERQNKIADLVLAKRLGLNIPESILTNDSKALKKFVTQYKSLIKDSGLKAFYSNSKLRKFKSSSVSIKDLSHKGVTPAPVELQSYIEKEADIRSYLVGGKIHSISIKRKKLKSIEIDWKGEEKDYTFNPIKLPLSIQTKLISFAKYHDYKLCCFDLLLTSKNKIIFLEMNRPGQWYFAQLLSGLDLGSKIVRELV